MVLRLFRNKSKQNILEATYNLQNISNSYSFQETNLNDNLLW